MLDGQQAEVGIARERGMIVNLERDQGIVFGLHQQGRHANAVQKLIGGLGGVIIVGGAESEGRRREFVVKLVDALDAVEMVECEQAGVGLRFEADALLQTAEENAWSRRSWLELDSFRAQAARSMGVETAMTPAMSPGARSPSSPASLRTTLPPSEKPARKMGAVGLDLADDGQQVGRLSGVIEAAAAEMFGAAAASHVEAVGGASGLEQFMRQTLSIARLAGAFQAVDHDYFGDRWAGRTLRVDEYANARLGVIELNFNGEALGVHGPSPVIGRDGKQVGVLEEGNECSQNTILSVARAQKRKGRTRRPP